MKKIFMLFLFVTSISFLLVSCKVGDNKSDDKNWTASLDKAQKIEVLSPKGSEPITTMTNDQEIKKFVKALKLDKWKMKDVPSKAIKGEKYKMYQENTVKLGESGKGKNELNKIAGMTTYKDTPYIDFNIKNNTFSFKVPEEVAEYLSKYK
ncbi:hypothetical protein [Tuberibacillus sp. Marseille-P3662]|uniref:hypothetical protein n=1 Tax=Tuberibacillus sp. Marseille-P3662 TaxID=1965358 RepID=UPI000A1CC740|nr:hypothetical protein [Tuberibacillus sp. Marseille-P3662]